MRIGLITRCKDEPYIAEFVRYYLSQGVDHIYVVDDDSDAHLYDTIHTNPCVTIVKHKINNWKHQFVGCSRLYKSIRNQYDWIINVDVDEYITTKKNGRNTIRQELETTFKDCMCVKVPWVMMSINNQQKNPPSLLETNVYRWNHDNKHVARIKEKKFMCRYDEIEVKCIFKPAYFNDIYMHHPLLPTASTVKIVESIRNTNSDLSCYYNNLREADIRDGYLLCYHYRIVSVAHCIEKIKTNLHYKKYTLNDLLSMDYPEIVDETLKKTVTHQQPPSHE
jgi:hypothetical protein